MLVLSNEEIEKLVSMEECLSILEGVYRDLAQGDAQSSPRIDTLSPCGRDDAYYAFKQMGGVWPRWGVQALRINSDVLTHPAPGGISRRVKLPLANGRWVGLVFLFSTRTGELLAIFPDGVVQRLRVGATSGLGIKYLSRPDARRAGIIGSGWQAGAQLMALAAVREISEIKVYSVHKENREAFARDMAQKLGIPVYAVDSPEECVQGVDIVMAATSSLVPVIKPEWLREGMCASCITVREADEDLLDRCDRVALHSKLQLQQIDLIMPVVKTYPREYRDGWWQKEDRWRQYPDLPEIISGKAEGRNNARQITCFVNNIGLGLQFAAVGALILEKARKLGIGRELPGEWFSQTVHP